ncbi:Cell division protein SepF [Candidatus Desulfosporosinus infrequens]|uniref:Cell division protein SepF n=1 Tax=Candidatus Desulfosporosinus infrequens TaxID=2043169 RepID=A0A2U3LS07_9FIRM|nr:Cell division protein SepF [Candidatus Desulfosporosinus infrequens]
MSNILNTALELMGFLDTNEEDGFENETKSKIDNKKTISLLPKTSQPIIVHITPKAFDDVMDLVKRLQNKTIVTINLALVDVALSNRIIDFANGAVYALDGGVLKLADNVYLLAGQGVTLQERDTSNFPWNKEPI